MVEISALDHGHLYVADHDLAFAYCSQDPDGNHLELTTYDHEPVRMWLKCNGRNHA
ncbi:hypothetical protein [Cognatiyoonia sp. IB215182]|uniref:hypothetical protein n=1 Tax=Cognatiyoonia sp. IB215182 TaxID=3097353 RepID=UPI002A0CC764|nr:hypothetical protein [Cognatiyoonia sp. IB215182]MDX8354033.1 hypothetical protein [Cognatiyoonia sp. IB215182]